MELDDRISRTYSRPFSSPLFINDITIPDMHIENDMARSPLLRIPPDNPPGLYVLKYEIRPIPKGPQQLAYEDGACLHALVLPDPSRHLVGLWLGWKRRERLGYHPTELIPICRWLVVLEL